MSIINSLDLVESVSNLAISQPTDKLPEQTLNLIVVELSCEVNPPKCEYDETLTKSLVLECWHTFCADLRKDPSGVLPFERLVDKIQTKFLLQILARDMEFEKKQSLLDAEIKSISLVAENTQCEAKQNQRQAKQENEAQMTQLISSHEAMIMKLTSSHETEKHETKRDNEAKTRRLISLHESEKLEIKRKNKAKIRRLISSYQTEKREAERKNNAKISKSIASHEIEKRQIERDNEAKISNLISSHESEKRQIEQGHEAEISKLVSSHEIEKRQIEQDTEAKINKLISSHDVEKHKIRRDNEAEISKLISSHKIEEQTIRNTHDRSLDAAKAEHRANIEIEQRSCKAKIQAYQDHLATHRENVECLRREVANLKEQLHLGSYNAKFSGSLTRSDVWKGIKSNINNKTNEVFVTFTEQELVPESRVRHLVDQVFSDEKDMYQPVKELMTELFAHSAEEHLGVKVFDTHNIPFLGGYMPDITVTLGNLGKVDQLSVYCVVELKTTSKLDDAAFGQTVDYLFALNRVQPSRRRIAALLSSIQENYVIVFEHQGNSNQRITQYASVSFAKAMTYIKNLVLKEPQYFPTVPKLGTMRKRLGNPRNSVVGEFEVPKGLPAEPAKFKTMAVKRAAIGTRNTDVLNEISLLELIRDRGGCSQLPTLIYVSDNKDEFGIAPVGQTLNRNSPGTGPIIRRILRDVLAGIQWLHCQNIVHRDIRWDNIVIHNEQAYLIDLGNSVIHDSRPKLYAGGYICCPKKLIGDMDKEYVPEFADDYMAFLLLISLLLFPGSGNGMTSSNLAKDSNESVRMKRFWKEMEESPFWKRYYQAAMDKDGAIMSELFNLFVTV